MTNIDAIPTGKYLNKSVPYFCRMKLKYFLIGAIVLSLFVVGTLGVSVALAKTLTVTSFFLNQTGGNGTGFNGTSQTLEGTDEEIASQYHKLGEEFDKKSSVKSGDPVTFIFRNNTNVTIPYSDTYKNSASDELLNDALNGTTPVDADKPEVDVGLGEPGDMICWIDNPKVKKHFVCTGAPIF